MGKPFRNTHFFNSIHVDRVQKVLRTRRHSPLNFPPLTTDFQRSPPQEADTGALLSTTGSTGAATGTGTGSFPSKTSSST